MVTPISRAALRLITNSNFAISSRGSSAGFAPLKIRSTSRNVTIVIKETRPVGGESSPIRPLLIGSDRGNLQPARFANNLVPEVKGEARSRDDEALGPLLFKLRECLPHALGIARGYDHQRKAFCARCLPRVLLVLC